MATNKAAAAAAAVIEEWICEEDDDVSEDVDFDVVSFSVGNREILLGEGLMLLSFCTRAEWPDRGARKAWEAGIDRAIATREAVFMVEI